MKQEGRLLRGGDRLLGDTPIRGKLPRPDWDAVDERSRCLPECERVAAWSAAERAWHRRLASAWGGTFRLIEDRGCLLTTDLPEAEATKVLSQMHATLGEIDRLLQLDRRTFGHFVEDARWGDGGEAACQQLYGCGLMKLVPEFILAAVDAGS